MSIATTYTTMPKRMEKTTCFRNTEHLDELLKKISDKSGIPVSSLIRHCLTIQTVKLAKEYGIDVNGN
jgi:predicted DNA-binding protein